MPSWFKATGLLSSIAVLIALVIVFFKQLVALIAVLMTFIGVITFAIKAFVIFAFAALFISVAVVIFRSWQGRQKKNDD
jgi:hypothetical protein